jgi:HlyD family secretion protein
MTDPRPSTESMTLDVPSPDSGDSNDLDTFEPTVEDLPSRRRFPRLQRPTLALARPRSRRDWIRVGSAALLIALLAALGAAFLSTRSEIKLAKARQGQLSLTFGTTGTLQTATFDANFAGSGRVAEISVAVGQQVSSGDTLAKLDTTQLQDAYNEARAAVSAAQSTQSDAENHQQSVQSVSSANVAAAFSAEQSAITACGANNACVQAAQDQYAAVQARADSDDAAAQAQVNSAQAQLATAQAKLQTAQDNLNGATLTAPHDGTIAAISGTVGTTVVGSNATAPVTSFIKIADLNTLQLLAHVPVANVGAVAKSNPVQFTVPVVGNQVFGGTVAGVSPIGESGASGLTYPITIDVDMSTVRNAHLFTGMAARVTVATQQRFGVLLVPASAVAYALAAGDPKRGGFLTRTQVTKALGQARQLLLSAQDAGTDVSADQPTPGYLLERSKNGWVVKPVVLGLTDGVSYEVLLGISTGDTIVTGETNSSVSVPTATPTTSSGR